MGPPYAQNTVLEGIVYNTWLVKVAQIEICFQDMREGVGNCIELTFAARISTLQNSSSELVNLRSVL